MAERVLMGLIFCMAAVFVITAIAIEAPPSAVVDALFRPEASFASVPATLALIGTTLVPLSLFLQSSASAELAVAATAASSVSRSPHQLQSTGGAAAPGGNKALEALHNNRQTLRTLQGMLKSARMETAAATLVVAVITMAIMATAAGATAASGGGVVRDAAGMAGLLQVLLGPAASAVFGAGLAAAGLSSGLTAPLSAGPISRPTVAASCLLPLLLQPQGLCQRLTAPPQHTQGTPRRRCSVGSGAGGGTGRWCCS